MSSKGQVTVPKAVRDALGLREGDDVVFRVEGDRAVLARTPELLSLAPWTASNPESSRTAPRLVGWSVQPDHAGSLPASVQSGCVD